MMSSASTGMAQVGSTDSPSAKRPTASPVPLDSATLKDPNSLPPLPPPPAANVPTTAPALPDDVGIPPNTFGHLGINVEPVGNEDGLKVVGIERTSPAFPAGLLIDDEIAVINGQRISTFGDLVKGLRAAGQGDGSVSLLVRRRGTLDTINIMVGGKKAQLERPKLGVTLDDSNGRLRVIGITPKSPAAVAGVQIGDEIITVNDYPISTYDLFVSQIQALGRAGGQVPLGVRRNGKMLTLRATIGAAKAPPLPKDELPPAVPSDIK